MSTPVSVPAATVSPTLNSVEASKRLAAYAAVDKHVRPEHKVYAV